MRSTRRRATAPERRRRNEQERYARQLDMMQLMSGMTVVNTVDKAAAKLNAQYASKRHYQLWLGDALLAVLGFDDPEGGVGDIEPDTNFRQLFVPTKPRPLEQVFGLRPMSTTADAITDSWLFDVHGTFVPARKSVVRPFDDSIVVDASKTASDPAFVRSLVVAMDAAADSLQAAFGRKQLGVKQSYVTLMRHRPPRGINVRALLLALLQHTPSATHDQVQEVVKPVLEMLICSFQHDEVSYSDMLAAVYMVAYMVLVQHDVNYALLEHIAAMPQVHVPFHVRINIVRQAIQGPLSMLL